MKNEEWRERGNSQFEIRNSKFEILLSSFDLRIRVSNHRKICRPRPCVELRQQGVMRRLFLQLGHLAVRIVHIAEHNRLGRAGLLAGGPHLTVAYSLIAAAFL